MISEAYMVKPEPICKLIRRERQGNVHVGEGTVLQKFKTMISKR
jgi:hypothetical protein